MRKPSPLPCNVNTVQGTRTVECVSTPNWLCRHRQHPRQLKQGPKSATSTSNKCDEGGAICTTNNWLAWPTLPWTMPRPIALPCRLRNTRNTHDTHTGTTLSTLSGRPCKCGHAIICCPTQCACPCHASPSTGTAPQHFTLTDSDAGIVASSASRLPQ